MTVSVIMSVFNGQSFLAEAVESILNQTFEDFEFIIVNDGSTDRSGLMLDQYALRDDRVRVVHQDNQGLVRALNLACSLAQGKYLARMDADDVAIASRLRLQVNYLEAEPGTGVLGSAVQFIDDLGTILALAPRPLHDREIKRALLDENVFWHPSVMMRADIFRAVGGYRNIADAEDYDLWLRMAECSDLANLSSPLLHYRIHGSQVSMNRIVQQALSALACQASMKLRLEGKPDLLQAVTTIDSDLLTRMDVSAGAQQTAVGRGYLVCGRNLSRTSSFVHALAMLRPLNSGDLSLAAAWVLADAHVCTAKIHWARRNYRHCLGHFFCALLHRPLILGRPLKTLSIRVQQMAAQYKSHPEQRVFATGDRDG